MSKKHLFLITLPFIFAASFIIFYSFLSTRSLISPLGSNPLPFPTPTPKPLLKYSFAALKQYQSQASTIQLHDPVVTLPTHTTYHFDYLTEGSLMTGQLNYPAVATPSAGFPLILMIRGYVDPDTYTTGTGTKNAAAFFTSHGYVTLAPDFLGYGGSANPPQDVFAERLQKPLHLLDLLASVPSLPGVNPSQIGIWAHSNGGQIALSLLEVTQTAYPTTLWAPVTKPFPYSILYYTDAAEDQGKALRRELAQFEANYDVFDFSIDHYWADLTAPIQLHQGTADDAVPLTWSTDFVVGLNKLDKDITYYQYPGADHNLRPSWDTVIARDLDFFNHHLHP